MGFLPINRREMQRLGWEQPDFVYVTGDAYVDHPSFGQCHNKSYSGISRL